MADNQLPVLQAAAIQFDVTSIASALWMSPDVVVSEFKDARLSGRLAEEWGKKIFNYQRHISSNYAGSDAIMRLGAIGRYAISVRAFGKGNLRFQHSKFMGSGRACTQDQLIESLESVEAFVAVDLRQFPSVIFYPFDTKPLLRLAYSQMLSPNGMSPKQFDAWVKHNFDLKIETHATTSDILKRELAIQSQERDATGMPP